MTPRQYRYMLLHASIHLTDSWVATGMTNQGFRDIQDAKQILRTARRAIEA